MHSTNKTFPQVGYVSRTKRRGCRSSAPCNNLPTMKTLNIQRTKIMLRPDPARVLIRPFNPTTEQRALKISARVMALAEEDVRALLDHVLAEFGERHLQTRVFLHRRFGHVRCYLVHEPNLYCDLDV